MKCCGIQEGIKLQMAVSFPESICTCSPESAQKVGFCFNTRAEGIWCAFLASIIVHQGCICVDVQLIYSRFQESHSIPGLSLSPAFFFFFLAWEDPRPSPLVFLTLQTPVWRYLLPTQNSATVLHHHLSKCQTWSSDSKTQPGLKPLQLYPEVYLRSSLPSELEEII